METMPVRLPGIRPDAMMGEVEPLVSRVMKRRWELAVFNEYHVKRVQCTY
jgi:uncharacterized protein VirK/YbjX